MIKGMDRRPYIEVTSREEAETNRLWSATKYAALSGLAIQGIRWAGTNITFDMDPTKLSYLHEGLSTPDNPWWKVAGLKPSTGKEVRVRAKDVALEAIKRGEEFLGGIPRTFGIFGMASRGVFTNSTSFLRLTPEALDGAWSHYETLIKDAGGQVEELDKGRGFIVKQHGGKSALFRVDTSGNAVGAPLVEDVKIQARRWGPDGVPDRYRQIIRDVDTVSESMGAQRIKHSNNFPFVVTKASGNIRIDGALRSTLEAFGDVDKLQSGINSVMTERVHQGLRDSHVLAKRMSERYMRILDQPLEFIQELVYGGPYTEGGLLKKASDSKAYGFFKNIFGTGGNYSGNLYDLWARHAGRMAVATVGIAAAYEAGSMVTNTLFDKSLAQTGGEIVGTGERLLAGVSDLTGMTALNKAQEDTAAGSGRLLGVLAFPFSGYLTGHVLGGMTTRLATPAGELQWRVARQEIHEIPKVLQPLAKVPVLGKYFKGPKTRGGVWGAVGMAIGGALSLPFLPGSLGSSESYKEVVAKQRGETEVAVRKGAYWEMGRTDIEGDKVDYYRPGWYRRMQDDGFNDLQYGEYGDRPLTRMVKSLFNPYWREKEYYHERPYAVTGPDTTGMGPLGTLWGMTLGRVFKQPAYMHEDEISVGGNEGVRDGDVVRFGKNVSEAPDASLGGLGAAPVVSPYDQSFLAGEGIYKLTEAIGLPGFAISAIRRKITGEGDWGVEDPVLSSFAEVGSMRENFWGLNIGGGFGSTEALRRVVPNERFQLDKVNPIANKMPDWMPGPEYYKDFRHGDPYAAVQEGEYRLPGSGYAARFKELEDVDPEDYPLIHRYKILGDVAPYSKQFKSAQDEVRSLAKSGKLSERDMLMYRGTEAQLENKSRRVNFAEDDGLIGGYWSALKKIGRANPIEHLLPVSPVHKFAGPLDKISEYESRNVYSTNTPSWGTPIEDFVVPAINNAARLFGYEGIPKKERERRELEGYFDKLEYTKYKRLEAEARGMDDGRAAFAYARKAEYTMYGADPYTDVDTAMRVLPSQERAYFKDFIAADSAEEKGRILELTPEYTHKFYLAQWQKQIYAGMAAQGDLSEDQQLAVSRIEEMRSMEGESATFSEWNEYQDEVSSGDARANTFPDFIRAKRLGGYFENEAPLEAPPTDWLGYDPNISMDDVKLKVIENKGLDHHDFGLWEDDVAAARRKPYLDVVAADLLAENGQDRDDLVAALTALRMRDLDIEIVDTGTDKTRIAFDIGQDRTGQLKAELEKQGIRYGV